jgi:hypothetical protein
MLFLYIILIPANKHPFQGKYKQLMRQLREEMPEMA